MSTATHVPHIPDDDLALFAMQLLPEHEMTMAFDHLQICDICRPKLAALQGDLAVYALTSDLHSPPAHSREQLMRRVSKEKKFVAAIPIDRKLALATDSQEPILAPRNRRSTDRYPPQEERETRRSASVAAWAGWAIAAGVGLFAFLQFQQRQELQNNLSAQTASYNHALADAHVQTADAQEALHTLTDIGAMRVALRLPGGPPPKTVPEASATYVASKGALVMTAIHLNQLTADKTYELWLLPAEKDVAPIPAGTFRPDALGNASVVMPELPRGVTAKGFGVTIEDDGGSKTPTPPIVLAGF